MKKLLIMDAEDYDVSLPEIYRISVRGIIIQNGKLLLTESKYGETKLPGGGQEQYESDINTLIREVKEETGYTVIPDSVIAFGEIEKKRLSTKEPKIWNQLNRLYFCDVGQRQEECTYTENEKNTVFIKCGTV